MKENCKMNYYLKQVLCVLGLAAGVACFFFGTAAGAILGVGHFIVFLAGIPMSPSTLTHGQAALAFAGGMAVTGGGMVLMGYSFKTASDLTRNVMFSSLFGGAGVFMLWALSEVFGTATMEGKVILTLLTCICLAASTIPWLPGKSLWPEEESA